MTGLFRRNLKISVGLHAAVIAVLIVVPLILNWRLRRKEPHEIVTYIDLRTAVVEPPSALPVPEVKQPEPPKDIPEPSRKKIKKSKKKIKRQAPEQAALTPEEIKKLLDAGKKSASPSRPIAGDLPAWYYALVRQTMYDAWNQPGGLAASAGLMTRVSIRVERDGRVTRRKQVRSSGNSLVDESVMKAVNAVSRLRPLPAPFSGGHKDITIDFELTGGSL